MQQVTFITLAVPGKSVLKALMMANSLRSFGGKLKDSTIWVLVPEVMNEFPKTIQSELTHQNVLIVPFEITPDELRSPFAVKILAAAHAEAAITGNTELLAWLDCDNIILHEPGEFLLPDGAVLGYRPVHHKLIGPAWDQPLDPFWKLIYQSCAIPGDRQFQMTTHIGEKTRPYFNAGTFVIRPERQLMAKWRNAYLELFDQPEFQPFYQKDTRYIIFMHQAIFTGVLLHELELGEMLELSPKVNYPLHLHAEIPAEIRPENIADLTTARYEETFESPAWRENLPIREPLLSWLEDQSIIRDSATGTT